MQRMGVQTSHPWPLCPKTSLLLLFLRPFFTFISFSSRPPSLHADEMSLNFVRLAYVGGKVYENSSISYWKVSCGRRIRDFVIYIHRMEDGFPYSPLHLYLYSVSEEEYRDIRDFFFKYLRIFDNSTRNYSNYLSSPFNRYSTLLSNIS